MRAVLRVLAGLILVTGGVLSLAAGVAAWVLGLQRTDGGGGDQGAFVTTLAPVHSDGYAVVVPDVADALARHGVGRYLGDGRLTITVRSDTSDLVVVSLVPAVDAARYVSGTAHTDVMAVGYSTGEQPVETVERSGEALSGPPPWELAAPESVVADQAGRLVTVSLDVPTQRSTSLVVRRMDGLAGLTIAVTVGFAPSAWGTATLVLLTAGGLGMLSGLALLVLRRPWIDPEHPLIVGLPATEAAPARLPRRRRRGARTEPEPVESPYVHTAT